MRNREVKLKIIAAGYKAVDELIEYALNKLVE
jgi:hypothetical protein